MSKPLYVGPDYIELDAMGVGRWKEMIIREFPLLAFMEYMEKPVTDDRLRVYSDQHLRQLNNCDLGLPTNFLHMNNVLATVSHTRCSELRSWHIEDVINKQKDPAGRVLSPEVQKAMVFLVPMLACACGAVDASYLYWAPSKSFKKADIVDFLETLPRVGTGYDINASKCAACTPRLYPQVIGSREWSLYATCDQSRCQCAGCGG